jgi:hypothetical protein
MPRLSVALLTLLVVPCVVFTGAARAQPSQGAEAGDHDKTEIHNFRLSMDLIQRAAATGSEVNRLIDGNPDLKKRWKASFFPESPIAQQVQNVELKCPEAASVVRSHGLTVRQFIVLRLALATDMYFVAAKKEGDDKDIPRGAVLPENESLIEQNWDRIHEMAADLGEE